MNDESISEMVHWLTSPDGRDDLVDLLTKITAPIDWPTRFRTAAEAAERERAYGIADHLQRGADDLPPAVLGAIGRALLGETETP